MDVAEISPPIGLSSRGLAYTLLISIGLHLLLLWQLSSWLQAERDSIVPSSLPGPLRITLAPPLKKQLNPAPEATAIEPINENRTQKQPDEAIQTTPADSASAGGTRERKITTAQIRQSATAIARDIADDGKEDGEKRSDPVSEILERALNKPKEKPGVYTRADGTTRVVTKQGFSYCIKPLEDWRIIDPEDDMRVSVYCK